MQFILHKGVLETEQETIVATRNGVSSRQC